MATKRNVTIEPIYRTNREPRPGELNYELKRILVTHCTNKPFKEAVKSVELAVNKLARRFGISEYECTYDRNTNTTPGKPWVVEGVQVRMYRRRSNGTLAIHRAGAGAAPHFFPKGEERYANLSAPRDVNIYYGIDDPYDWRHHTCKKPRRGLEAQWKRQGLKGIK